jgi:hypothetical protein
MNVKMPQRIKESFIIDRRNKEGKNCPSFQFNLTTIIEK